MHSLCGRPGDPQAVQGLSMSRAAKEVGRSIEFARYWAKCAGIAFTTYRGGRKLRLVVPEHAE
jgi:hypothetical protein